MKPERFFELTGMLTWGMILTSWMPTARTVEATDAPPFDRWTLTPLIVDKDTKPWIPSRKSRKKIIKYDKRRYKRRNRIERLFVRLKDWRRVPAKH